MQVSFLKFHNFKNGRDRFERRRVLLANICLRITSVNGWKFSAFCNWICLFYVTQLFHPLSYLSGFLFFICLPPSHYYFILILHIRCAIDNIDKIIFVGTDMQKEQAICCMLNFRMVLLYCFFICFVGYIFHLMRN